MNIFNRGDPVQELVQMYVIMDGDGEGKGVRNPVSFVPFGHTKCENKTRKQPINCICMEEQSVTMDCHERQRIAFF